MLTLPASAALSPELANVALITAAAVVIHTLVRLVLCALAVLAVRKALGDSGNRQDDADEVRAHRLAVLQAILAVFTRSHIPGRRPGQDSRPRSPKT